MILIFHKVFLNLIMLTSLILLTKKCVCINCKSKQRNFYNNDLLIQLFLFLKNNKFKILAFENTLSSDFKIAINTFYYRD